MRLLSLLGILAALAALSAAVTYILLFTYNVEEAQRIPIKIRVDDFIGFDLDSERLNFGVVPQGGCAQRNMTITSGFNEDVIARISIQGEVKDWISHESDVLLAPAQSRSVSFKACPKDAGTGDYEGFVIIQFYRT